VANNGVIVAGIVVFGFFVFGSYFISDTFAQSSEESLGSVVTNAASFGIAIFVFIGIPVLIITLIVLKIKRKLTTKISKKILLGIGVYLVGFLILGVASSFFLSDEEKAERDALREVNEAKKLKEEFDSRFDPAIVASAKKNLPEMQELPLEILRQCEKVNSYSKYEIFVIALAVNSADLEETIRGIDMALEILESEGFDKHPEVGPLIYQTRDTAAKAGNCIDKVISRYG